MLENGIVTDNYTYLFPVDKHLTNQDISDFIDYHINNESKMYQSKIDEYKTNAPILTKSFGESMLDHKRLAVPFPKYLVDTLNGFFVGIPPTITTKKEQQNNELQTWINKNSVVDKINEVSKQSSIYGRSYMLVYNNEQSETRVTVCSPTNSFMIFDDTIERKPLAFVNYSKTKDNEIVGDIYYSNERQHFTYSGGLRITEVNTLIFQGNVPAIEFYDNEERQGVFDNVLTLIHAINETLSAKSDDIDYFANSYLFLKNFALEEEEQLNIQEQRIISTKNPSSDIDVDAKFLEKPSADDLQENQLDRLTNLIFQTSMIANINDEVFGNATSGTALEYKLLSMRNLTANKERKFTQSLRWLFDVLATNIQIGEPSDFTYSFTRNLPNNTSEEADLLKNLDGVVSDETRLSLASFVKDPTAEIKRMFEEDKEKVKKAQENYPGADYIDG
ncbi:phage portal protein [Lactobacillus terrae]|uniref:phage portal protein n=1 Tax=Lactobacillus terrae TaxID=2269374 RepID=UPI000C1B7549|nr:phage portal protein [Lactobacillus terrae]